MNKFQNQIALVLFAFNASICAAQSQPDDFPGLKLWLRSDTGVTISFGEEFIGDWMDISGNENHASVDGYIPWLMPSLQPNQLNGYPTIRFDGVDDFFRFPEMNDVRTVFWIVKEDPAADAVAQRCLLGHSAQYNFLRGPEHTIWHPAITSNVLNGVTHLNFSQVDGTATVLPNDYCMISLVTTDNTSAETITQDRVYVQNQWWGDFAELIIYNQPLTPEQTLEVENYLANRYGPAYTPMADIEVEYGFCDTILCASEGFDEYLWGNGETTSCIAMTEPGEYTLQVKDFFNRVVFDTVNVTFPGNLWLDDATFCVGESFEWNTGLDENSYTFEWSNSFTGASQTFDEAGTQSVTVTDSLGCSFTTDIFLSVDDFPQAATLGDDAELCAGNTLSLTESYEVISYLWSTTEMTPGIVVNTSGEYWVEAVNENNCFAQDTINIVIVGTAPDIDFSFENTCEGDLTEFVSINLSSSEIASWQWMINDTEEFFGSTLSFQFLSPGDFLVTLTATTVEGCSTSVVKPLHIYSNPVASFTYLESCDNQLTNFTDASQSSEGIITEWSWIAGGFNYFDQNPAITIPSPGFNPVSLSVTTEYGCIHEQTVQVNVNASPIVNFDFENICQGDLTTFTQQVDDELSGAIFSYAWTFGDGIGSWEPSPQHYYSQNGFYDVRLVALANNYCADTLIQTIEIIPEPQPDFLVANACLGQPYQFQDFTITSGGDDVITWHWAIDDEFEFSNQEPVFFFDDTGFHQVELEVTTQAGCVASITQSVPVWPVPDPAFTFTPPIGSPPLSVFFNNETQGINSYQWDFGDTTFSNEFSPSHTYTSYGNFIIELTATNAFGCAKSVSDEILVAVPQLDLVVPEVHLINTPYGTQISALVVNAGNFHIYNIVMGYQLGNDALVTEPWQGNLAPGSSFSYTFNSHINPTEANFEFVCVQAIETGSGFIESNPFNNEYCSSLDDDLFAVFPPFPDPATTVFAVRVLTPIAGDVTLQIVSSDGKPIEEFTFANETAGVNTFYIPVQHLASGLYLLEVTKGSHSGTVRFSKF